MNKSESTHEGFYFALGLTITLTGLTYGWGPLWHPSIFAIATGVASGVAWLLGTIIKIVVGVNS